MIKFKKNNRYIKLFSIAACISIGFSLNSISISAKEDTNVVEPSLSVINKLKYIRPDSNAGDVRRFPYPYGAMLSICSDIDETTVKEFENYHKFLNTYEQTPYGKGLGLDIGDSFWMYMANDIHHTVDEEGNNVDKVMTFFKGIDATKRNDADLIKHFYNVGWIDCMHGFGDFSRVNRTKNLVFSRDLAQKAWDTLNAEGIHPTVWINHGNNANVENFGFFDKGMTYQQGDNPKLPYYHSDITIKNGIKFIWDSFVGKFGTNNPLYIKTLQDGQKVWAFRRYTSELRPAKSKYIVDWNWTPQFLEKQITKFKLNKIVASGQYSILAQHFGILNSNTIFKTPEIKALRMLADYQKCGRILVARTSRLLNYALARKCMKFNTYTFNNVKWINIISIDDPVFGTKVPSVDEIRGITFYTRDPQNTHILISGKPVAEEEIQRNPEDKKGQKSIGIKWFKADTTDYTSPIDK